MVRSATVRRDLLHLMDQIINEVGPNVAPGLQLPEFTENHAKGLHYEHIRTELANITNRLNRLRWVLVENKTPMQFLTSDYPFAIQCPNIDQLWPAEALPSDGLPTDALWLDIPGVRLFFPLTPRRMLLIGDPVVYAEMPEESGFYPETVTMVNELQVHRSNRFIFSETNNFVLVEKLIQQNPQLRETDRGRWNVTVKWEQIE
jgi:hypothetical protein